MRGRISKIVIVLNEKQRQELLQLIRSTTTSAGLARRARIVLLLSKGERFAHVAEAVGVTERVVRKWCHRYLEKGLAGLEDLPRSGRPPVFSPQGRHLRSKDCLRAARHKGSIAVALGL